MPSTHNKCVSMDFFGGETYTGFLLTEPPLCMYSVMDIWM